MRGVLESKPRSSDHPAMQRYASRPRPHRIVETVAEVFGTPAEDIRRRHGTLERRVVAWLGCYESMARLGSIAAVLRLKSNSHVPSLIAQCDRGLRSDKQLRVAIDACLERLRRELVPAADPAVVDTGRRDRSGSLENPNGSAWVYCPHPERYHRKMLYQPFPAWAISLPFTSETRELERVRSSLGCAMLHGKLTFPESGNPENVANRDRRTKI